MRVGIITHYYGSKNYGGVLQAYALTTYFNNHGIEAEQISYDFISEGITNNQIIKMKRQLKNFLGNLLLSKRYKKFTRFRNSISHSQRVYTDYDIKECVENYDLFITGSDQVWNLKNYRPSFFLDFVNNKSKISYSASFSMNELSDEEMLLVCNHLKSFSGIAMRESNLKNNIEAVLETKIVVTVDPVFLLEKDEWDKLASRPVARKPYIVTYFLGDSHELYRWIKDFAKSKGLNVICIAHSNGICKSDFTNGIKNLYDVGPEDFIGLIRGSSYIFTDSFHACAFSVIYKREFFVFNRKSAYNMSSRILELLKLVDARDHYFDNYDSVNLDIVLRTGRINYQKSFIKMKEMIDESKQYLYKFTSI